MLQHPLGSIVILSLKLSCICFLCILDYVLMCSYLFRDSNEIQTNEETTKEEATAENKEVSNEEVKVELPNGVAPVVAPIITKPSLKDTKPATPCHLLCPQVKKYVFLFPLYSCTPPTFFAFFLQ